MNERFRFDKKVFCLCPKCFGRFLHWVAGALDIFIFIEHTEEPCAQCGAVS